MSHSPHSLDGDGGSSTINGKGGQNPIPCPLIADTSSTGTLTQLTTPTVRVPSESVSAIVGLRSLAGGNKTLWITGAYGTGKSHTSLVLQKLFTDDEERVLRWLDLREAQIPGPVRRGLLERRNEKILVVYDLNADGVDAKTQFVMRLQRCITKALEAGGHTLPLRGKLDEVIERIRQDEPHFFAKRDEMQARLPHLNAGIKTADALEKRLRDAKQEAGLVSDAMRVLGARCAEAAASGFGRTSGQNGWGVSKGTRSVALSRCRSDREQHVASADDSNRSFLALK